MMRLFAGTFLAVVLICGVPFRPALAAEPIGPHRTELADNAALQYWKAFALMPPLDDEQRKMLEEWNSVDLKDAAVQKLLADSHSSLLHLRRGAQTERCDWGLDYNDGISLWMPYLAKARDLARLAALAARNEVARGNRGALAANASAMMTLARHVGRDPIMICALVRYNIEGIVVDLVAPYVPQIDLPYAKAVGKFERLPAAPSLHDTIEVEKEYFIGWMARKLREEEDRKPGAGIELWKSMMGADTPDDLRNVQTVGTAISMIEDLYPVYDELDQIVALPKAKFDVQYPEFKKRVETTAPLTRVLLPSVDSLLAKEHRNEARLAMLLAAMAVKESGTDALNDIKDPFGDGPFEYRALPQGYELRSQLLYEGQPVTLAIGQVNSQ